MSAADLQVRLQACLDARYAAWGVSGLRLLGGGLENAVFRADSAAFGPVAIRAPWARQISNVNDPCMDARDALRQEAMLAQHLQQYGVPVPAVFALHLGEDLDFLVSALVQGDGSLAEPREIGRVAAMIHRAPPPEVALLGMEGKSLAAVLAARISSRAGRIAGLVGRDLPMPPEEVLRAALDWPGARQRLLHMDLRPANFLARGGKVLAVVDWGNALLGDPALDVARALEYVEAEAEPFLTGYGDPNPFEGVPGAVELLYRLDTAVMLVGVFLEEAPDPALAARYLARVKELLKALGREL